MQIFYSPEFSRRYKRLSDDLRALAKEKEKIFKEDPFDPTLKTHKLHGEHSGCWAFWINYKYRIIFEFYKKDEVRFYAIGDHSIYNK